MTTSDRPNLPQVWDHHWRDLSGRGALFGWLASMFRKVFLVSAVRHYTDRFFASEGVFVETGCGTSQSSVGIRREGRRLLGVDFSFEALVLARQQQTFDHLVCADIRHLPFREDSIDGIWNLGVMEHFEASEGLEILREFERTLRADGRAVLFWPPTFGLSRWVLAPFEWLRSRISRREFRFFPNEVNRLRSSRQAPRLVQTAALEPLGVEFPTRAAFCHLVVAARRTRPSVRSPLPS